jgi:hypothetical protein
MNVAGVAFAFGDVLSADAQRARILWSDGTTSEAELIRVGEPIDAGFFLAASSKRTTRPTSVTALARDGSILSSR